MKDELYFLRFGFVKKMIVRKHFSLIKEDIIYVCGDEGDENWKEEMINELKKGFFKSNDEIIRAWIDFYNETKDGTLLRRILQSQPDGHPSKNTNVKPFTGLSFFINYLHW